MVGEVVSRMFYHRLENITKRELEMKRHCKSNLLPVRPSLCCQNSGENKGPCPGEEPREKMSDGVPPRRGLVRVKSRREKSADFRRPTGSVGGRRGYETTRWKTAVSRPKARFTYVLAWH